MRSDELHELEHKVRLLEEKHDHLENDIGLLKDIFKHIKDKFDELQKDYPKK